MQGAKDAFYVVLRDRVAARNAARTAVVRGVLRPAVLVVENELPGAAVDGISVGNAFCLRWTGLRVDGRGAMPLNVMTCEIRYGTDGSAAAAGMDRGRALTTMDGELALALLSEPRTFAVPTQAGSVSAVATAFWNDVAFSPAVMRAERMERTATVEVFCYGQ